MDSLKTCVNMYATSSAEKEACFNLFSTLHTQHETKTGTSCDDFTSQR